MKKAFLSAMIVFQLMGNAAHAQKKDEQHKNFLSKKFNYLKDQEKMKPFFSIKFDSFKDKERTKKRKKRQRYIRIAATVVASFLMYKTYTKYKRDIQKARDMGRTRKWFKLVLLLPGDDELAQYERVDPEKEAIRGVPLRMKKIYNKD